jgi:hypothetical protein
MNLTEEEGASVVLSDGEDEAAPEVAQWAVVGKVLSPTTVHATTIKGAMTLAWGNPHRLKICSIGEKVNNLFIAEFGDKFTMERALEGSSWLVGKNAVILRDYDNMLVPSQIVFDKIDLWVRIQNLPLGWMVAWHQGHEPSWCCKKLDVDQDGKASGAFLCARVSVELAKPLRRGVLLKTDRENPPEWYDLQYEKLPFFCHSCGVLDHGDLACAMPAPRNELGKLPYDVALRVSEDKKKKIQSLAHAAAETFGNASSPNISQRRGPKGRSSAPSRAEDSGMGTLSPQKGKYQRKM